MPTEIRGSSFPGLYEGVKYLPSDGNYGCIMLDVEPVQVTSFVEDAKDDLYYSPTQKYLKGAPAEETPHVTLLNGLLELGSTIRKNVDIALSGWNLPNTLEIERVGMFPSSVPGEDYSVIVAHIKVTDDLLDGHDRLRMLPHTDFFPTYRPHLTLAYVKSEATTEWVEALSFLRGQSLRVLGLNYGD